MFYNAVIRKIKPNDYDGYIVFELCGKTLSFYYQAPLEFAKEYLLVDKVIPVDIWIGLSEIQELPYEFKYVPFGQYPADGVVSGHVMSILNANRFRLDCGELMFDVQVDDPILPKIGTNLSVYGSRQVFFPNTEWSSVELV